MVECMELLHRWTQTGTDFGHPHLQARSHFQLIRSQKATCERKISTSSHRGLSLSREASIRPLRSVFLHLDLIMMQEDLIRPLLRDACPPPLHRTISRHLLLLMAVLNQALTCGTNPSSNPTISLSLKWTSGHRGTTPTDLVQRLTPLRHHSRPHQSVTLTQGTLLPMILSLWRFEVTMWTNLGSHLLAIRAPSAELWIPSVQLAPILPVAPVILPQTEFTVTSKLASQIMTFTLYKKETDFIYHCLIKFHHRWLFNTICWFWTR